MRVERPGEYYISNFPPLFLAGPTPRDDSRSWREEAIEYLRLYQRLRVLVPEPFCNNYEKQIRWETWGLSNSYCIVFWIPRNLDSLPGFTTNIEFGEWMKSGKVILGYPEGTPKMRYLHYRAREYGIPIFHTLNETLDAGISKIQERCPWIVKEGGKYSYE
jgi:hypothetical protein